MLGRNANGNMKLSYLGEKYKIILQFRPQHQTEITALFSKIPMQQLSVYFFNPYKNAYQTIQCYRGDRNLKMIWDRTKLGKLYEPVEFSLIQL